MRIAVCINHVPDSASKISIDSDNNSIIKNGLTYVFNPYDEYALEEALKIKDTDGSEIVVLSLGTEENKETLRKALALGADSAILLKTSAAPDSHSTAFLLAEAIKEIKVDLVFCGKQSIDHQSSIVGQIIAALLGYNCISNIVELKNEGGKFVVKKEVEGGMMEIEASLPALFTAQKGLNTPRYATLKGIMASKKKVIEEKEVVPPGNYTSIISYNSPPAKEKGNIVEFSIPAIKDLAKKITASELS